MREFGSEFHISYGADTYFSGIEGCFADFDYTRSGREALSLAARTDGPGLLLMPAYSCWSMDYPFEEAGWKIEYYRLNSDLTVDLDYLEGRIRSLRPKALLVMNYFGFAPVDEAVRLAKGIIPEIIVIEDFTHCLFTFDSVFDSLVDYYAASIRKSLGVPDGGVLYSVRSIDKAGLEVQDTRFSLLHKEAGILKNNYFYTADADEKQAFRSLQAEAGADIKENGGLYAISEFSESVLRNTLTDSVRIARQSNYRHLYGLVPESEAMRPLFAPSADVQAPFMMPVICGNRDELQSALAGKGVYCQLLWPLSERKREVCPVAGRMEETMLAVPIDQRYSYDDIEEMGERIREVVLK